VLVFPNKRRGYYIGHSSGGHKAKVSGRERYCR
jgi:hypothetical protein